MTRLVEGIRVVRNRNTEKSLDMLRVCVVFLVCRTKVSTCGTSIYIYLYENVERKEVFVRNLPTIRTMEQVMQMQLNWFSVTEKGCLSYLSELVLAVTLYRFFNAKMAM